MYFDKLGKIVLPGSMLMGSTDQRGNKWHVLGYLEQDGRIILRLEPNETLSIFDKKGFESRHFYVIPKAFSQFETAEGEPIKIGDHLYKDGMEAKVVQSRPDKDELMVQCRYTSPDAPIKGWWTASCSLTYLDILHAGWKIKRFAEYRFNHDYSYGRDVDARTLLPGAFFIHAGELHQCKDHNRTGWANCHNLNKATHPSINWGTLVTPVRVRIETTNL